ncbi:MAG: 30S ribosomal protein S17 [Gammaproteobacteria bacterium]
MNTEVTQSAAPNKILRMVSGKVISAVNDKTIIVEVERIVPYPKYGKRIKRRTKLHAHDAENKAKLGDKVTVTQCRPYSKMKSWRLVEIIEHTQQ